MLDKVDSLPLTAAPRARRWRWQWLVAPLMGISVVLHLALLFVPLPTADQTTPDPEEETPVEEEGPIDILSLSDVTAPEAPLEEPPTEAPAEAPPPASAEPPPPTLEQAQQPAEEEFAQGETELDDTAADDNVVEETQDDGAFDAARQQALLGRRGGINVEFDDSENFPANIWGLGYLDNWGQDKLNCFFASIDATGYQLAAGAHSLNFFTRNYNFVVQQDLPNTFSEQTLSEDPNGFCGEQLFEVQDNGVPIMYVSTLKVGLGNPPGSIVLIFWTSDPRNS